jgi:hypothetical protein
MYAGMEHSMRDKAVLAAVFLLALAPSLYVMSLSTGVPHLGGLEDDGIYWLCAKSLAQDHGYRILSLPGEPFQTKYPPLFPLLLSLVWRIWPAAPGNLAAGAALVWVFLPLVLLVSWRLFSQYGLGKLRACTLILLMGWSPIVAYLCSTLMAEMMFACLLLLALHFAENAANPSSAGWTPIAASLLAGVAFLTKTAAIPLLVTVPLCLLVRGQRRRAGLFLGGLLLFVLPWAIWVRTHRAGGGDVVTVYYTDYVGYQLQNVTLSRLPSLLGANAEGVLAGIGGLVVANTNEAQWLRIICRILAIVSIWGLFRLARRTGRLQHVTFTAGYLLTLLLWHFKSNERFVLPVLPVLLMGLCEAIVLLGGLVRNSFRTPAIAQRTIATGFTALFLVLCVTTVWAGGAAYLRYFPRFFESERTQLAEDRRLYAWIAANTPPYALFLAYKDTQLALWAGRPAIRVIVPPTLFYDRDRAAKERYFLSLPDFVRRHGVSYVVVSATDRYLWDVPDIGLPIIEKITSTDNRFRLRYRSERVALYEIIYEGAKSVPHALAQPPAAVALRFHSASDLLEPTAEGQVYRSRLPSM